MTQSPRHRATTLGDSPLARASRPSVSTKTDSIKVVPKLERQPSVARESVDSYKDETQKRRESELRKHTFFQLKVHLISGHGLVAMDKSGM